MDAGSRICRECGWVDPSFRPPTLYTSSAETRYRDDSGHAPKVTYACPQCHDVIDPGAQQCSRCGSMGPFQPRELSDPYMQQPTARTPAVTHGGGYQQPIGHQPQRAMRGEQQHKRCPRCGENISTDSSICPFCGADAGFGRRPQEAMRMTAETFVRRQDMPAPSISASQQTDYNQYGQPMQNNMMGPPVAPPFEQSPMLADLRKMGKGKGKDKGEKKERPISEGPKRFPVGLGIALMLVATGLVALAIVAVSTITGGGGGKTTTPSNDITPPVITDITIQGVTNNSIIVTWDTDEPSTSQVMICDPAGTCTSTLANKSLVRNHTVTVRGLKPGTKYKVTVNSKDKAVPDPNEAISKDVEVTTLTQGNAGTLVISDVSTFGITEKEGTIRWTTDKPATTQVAYGETTSYGSTTPFVSSLSTDHQVTLSNLEPGTTYHLQIKSKDASGGETTYPDKELTTMDNTPPVISSVSITAPSTTSFTVSWNTDERTTGKVEYGTGTSYSLSAYDATLSKTHSITISNVQAGTSYSFRIIATDGSNHATEKIAATNLVSGYQIGNLSPDFTLTDVNENSISLSSFRGKKVFVNFWATWCVPCMAEMPHIQSVWQAHQNTNDLVVLAVNNQEAKVTIQSKLTEKGLTFSYVLLDPQAATLIRYGSKPLAQISIPMSFYIDSNGIIKAMKVGAFNSTTDLETFLKNTP